MNFVSVAKMGDQLVFGEEQTTPALGDLLGLPDDRYIAGFRPNHLKLERPGGRSLAFHAQVTVTEITGSESYIHLQYGDDAPWVALAHGVHELPIGEPVDVYRGRRQPLYLRSARSAGGGGRCHEGGLRNG